MVGIIGHVIYDVSIRNQSLRMIMFVFFRWGRGLLSRKYKHDKHGVVVENFILIQNLLSG